VTVAYAWKIVDFIGGKTKIVKVKMTYGAGDTTITCATGLRTIDSFSVSPSSKNAVYPSCQAVDGGTITLTVIDSTPDTAYIFMTAYGH
jgi:hypothetical protein